MAIAGVDVSQEQGVISDADWGAIAASGVRFVYCRAGVGNNVPDTNFTNYVTGARKAGLIVGAYHFVFPLPTAPAHPGRDPVTQAQAHFQACGGLGSAAGDLPPAADLEWPLQKNWAQWGVDAAFIFDWISTYLEQADALWGRSALLYTDPSFAVAIGFDPAWAQRRLWLASYQSPPNIPAPWMSCVMQQTTGGGGKLPSGVPVDTDIVADEATLQGLLA